MAGRYDENLIARIQQANDIIDVVSEHVRISPKGKEMVGLCPFHEDHKPSMYVSPVKQIFKCFACGAGGDAFKFIQMRENLSFGQAIERLAERAGIELPRYSRNMPDEAEDTERVDPNELARVNKWAAKLFEMLLWDKQKGKTARDYIAERGFTEETARKWQFGLADTEDTLVKQAQTKGIDYGLLEKAGLAVRNASGTWRDKFENRLMFTITDATGRVIGFGGRTLGDSPAKYMNSPATALFDKSNAIFGLQQARHGIVSSGTAVVVEGYTDCIMAHQYGCDNVVATLGTSFTAGHGRLLKRYANRIVLLFDNDVAGAEAANRALEVCLSQRIDIALASVSQGKDPCDYLLAEGAEGFEKLIAGATDVFEFKWSRLRDKFASDNTMAGRKQAVDEFLQTIATIHPVGKAAIERGIIVNRLASVVGIEAREINRELAKKMRKAGGPAVYATANSSVVSISWPGGAEAAAQKEILEVLLNEPELLENAGEGISARWFDTEPAKQIAAVFFESMKEAGRVRLQDILARIESPELSGAIVSLAREGEEKGNFQRRLTESVEFLKRRRSDIEITSVDEGERQRDYLRMLAERRRNGNRHVPGMR